MADNQVNYQALAVALWKCVHANDVIGAKRLLVGIEKQDKKMIVGIVEKYHAPLSVAVERGNTDMMEFLVKECQASIEEVESFPVIPLCYAAEIGSFEVVKLLLELGADINAVSKTETMTSVNYACSKRRKETVTFLVRQGADIHRPDKRGETCLMNSVQCLELCQFLIDNGARVNEQDNFGNTALHHAIKKGDLETVQFLLDHGSDQNIKNNQGDDAHQFASIHGKDFIVTELETRQKPTISRRIESLQLLGSYFFLLNREDSCGQAWVYWRRSVTFRMMNSSAELRKSESTSFCMNVKEVNTLEDLEELRQDLDMAHMYALENLIRYLRPGHSVTIEKLINVSNFFSKTGKYKCSFDLLKYELQHLQECTPAWTKEHLDVLKMLLITYFYRKSEGQIKFSDVLEIFDMVTSKVQVVKKHNWYYMQIILEFVCLVVKLNKTPDELVRFKQVIYRVARSRIRDKDDRTFLHHAAEKCWTYPGVVEVLLEFGADVNSLDGRNNTALHLAGTSRVYPDPLLDPDARSKAVKLLLQYSAHIDIVNDYGKFAETGLSLNMLDHVNLKCLATAVIRDHQIPYKGQMPESLESFVEMHGSGPRRIFNIDLDFLARINLYI